MKIYHQILGVGIIGLALLVLLSCKKDQTNTPPSTENPPTTLPSCSKQSGYFTIEINGEPFELVVDNETHFTCLYNWFDEEQSAFVIYGKDQNSNPLRIELAVSDKFTVGNTNYTFDFEDYDIFEISVDTFDLYVSDVNFNVVKSNLGVDGIYKPLKASFTGMAHSYPLYNGHDPEDTLNISGSFCINEFIIN